MRVGVRVGIRSVPILVGMLVMRVMDVLVRVRLGEMDVMVLMPFRDVQPNSNGHQQARRDQLPGDGLVMQDNRQPGAEERRD